MHLRDTLRVRTRRRRLDAKVRTEASRDGAVQGSGPAPRNEGEIGIAGRSSDLTVAGRYSSAAAFLDGVFFASAFLTGTLWTAALAAGFDSPLPGLASGMPGVSTAV